MIKKILILCFVLIKITSAVNASGSCLISNWPSNSLSKYLETNKKIIQNITNEISSSDFSSNKSNYIGKSIKENIIWTFNDISKSINDNIVWMFNSIINWTGYMSYFNYYVIFPIGNDITKEVRRDYKMLENEWEWLNKFLEVIAKKWYNLEITNACDWIQNCNLEWTVMDIVWELIKNQSYIIDIYRRAVTWSITEEENNNTLIIVDNENNKFVKDIIKHYWIWNNCVSSEDSFFTKIRKQTELIWDYNKTYKNWIQEWKDAIALINWDNVTPEYEEQLLIQELARQWISWSRAQAIRDNLNNYNSNWNFSEENNFVSNTFNHLWNQIYDEVEKFDKNVIQEFKKMWDEQTTRSITSLLDDNDKVKVNIHITESVSEIYNSELPFIEIWDKNSILIRTDIINMHNNLNNWNKTLKKLCEVAVKICNDQSRWEWLCWTCN